MSEPHVILASGSPRRSEILTRIGVPHTIQIPNVDESTIENETIQEYVIRVALEKYREVERQTLPGNWLIAADTMVELDGEWLGKPADANGAIRMLRKMSGRKHTVWTGVVIGETGSDKMKTLCERSDVDFMPLSESEINKYVSGGEPLDKAGAYGVQGEGARYVRQINGCFFNVMGLPVAAVYKGLRELGWSD